MQRIPTAAQHFFAKPQLSLGLHPLQRLDQVVDRLAGKDAVDADSQLYLPAVSWSVALRMWRPCSRLVYLQPMTA